MSEINEHLFEAFRVDHAALGTALHELAVALRAGDMSAARACAERIDRQSGAHIAFEELDFYPALARFLDEPARAALYKDHAEALVAIEQLCDARSEAALAALDRRELLHRVEAMQVHVAECGELFGVMGGLSLDEKHTQLMRLQHWRALAPRWRAVRALKADADEA